LKSSASSPDKKRVREDRKVFMPPKKGRYVPRGSKQRGRIKPPKKFTKKEEGERQMC